MCLKELWFAGTVDLLKVALVLAEARRPVDGNHLVVQWPQAEQRLPQTSFIDVTVSAAQELWLFLLTPLPRPRPRPCPCPCPRPDGRPAPRPAPRPGPRGAFTPVLLRDDPKVPADSVVGGGISCLSRKTRSDGGGSVKLGQ